MPSASGTALLVIGLVMLAAWPIALFVMKDKPSDIGQFPDGDFEAHEDMRFAGAVVRLGERYHL
jgi:hypothetical protein